MKQVLPRQFAEALMHAIPTVHGAGNRHGVDAFLRHALDVVLSEERRREGAGGGSRCIQSGELAALGVPIHHEEIAAEARHHWFGDAKNRVRSDGGVDGRSAVSEDLRAGLGSQNLAGGRDSLLADDDGSAIIAAEHLWI